MTKRGNVEVHYDIQTARAWEAAEYVISTCQSTSNIFQVEVASTLT